MASRSGLKKVTKQIRGKHGTTQRAYWVRSNPKPSLLQRHGKKLLIGAALVGTAAAAYAGRHHIAKGATSLHAHGLGAFSSARKAAETWHQGQVKKAIDAAPGIAGKAAGATLRASGRGAAHVASAVANNAGTIGHHAGQAAVHGLRAAPQVAATTARTAWKFGKGFAQGLRGS